jgi:DNA-directed RNA polymerase subunit RPC12/RpoP
LIKLETEEEIKPIKCKRCGNGMLVKEDRHEQFRRIEAGIKALFPYEKDESVHIRAQLYRLWADLHVQMQWMRRFEKDNPRRT